MGEISITIKTKYNVGDFIVFREKHTGTFCCGIIKEISYDRGNHNIEYTTSFENTTTTEMDILITIDKEIIKQLIKENQLLVEESLVIFNNDKIRDKIKKSLKDTTNLPGVSLENWNYTNLKEAIYKQCLEFIDEVEKEM